MPFFKTFKMRSFNFILLLSFSQSICLKYQSDDEQRSSEEFDPIVNKRFVIKKRGKLVALVLSEVSFLKKGFNFLSYVT